MTTTLVRRPDLLHRLSGWLDLPEVIRWDDTRPGAGELIRIEQRIADGELEIRAEMPGLDPDKDVDISINGGMLTITAERHEESKGEKDGATFSEFRYGAFSRTVRVPEGVSVNDVKASYKDGILSIVAPMPEQKKPEPVKVPISHN